MSSADQLDPARPYKPLDVGNGIVSGTLTPAGRWLSLGMAHPVHGRVVLTSAPPFVGERRDQAVVRAYRASLADPGRQGFGIDLGRGADLRASFVASALPHARRDADEVEITTFAPARRRGAVQIVRGSTRSAWSGPMRLRRAAYTQLTEGGPLAEAPSEPREGGDDEVRWIDDRALGAAAAFARPREVGGFAVAALALGTTLREALEEARALRADGPALLRAEVAARRGTGEDGDPTIARALAYALDCCASDVGGAVALLADHEILPLVWTRDAYYVARALLAVAPADPRARAAVEGFLRWCFERAERPEGWWPRASLASGQVKDPAFQLDQQLYPLLLLTDAVRLLGDRALLGRYGKDARGHLERVLARRTSFGLVTTDETPADDALAQPYHFSSHVLLWRACVAMSELFDGAIRHEAEGVRQATLRHFADRGRFAYAVAGPDGSGARHYHDANDLPTVFAPGWGFCGADDPLWAATIDFAWSDENAGHFAGPFGGLGSLHTPHPWPLGDLQRAVVARARGDPAAEASAFARLAAVETWDALLPEAYDENSGGVASRHWFAWPTALRAMLLADRTLNAP